MRVGRKILLLSDGLDWPIKLEWLLWVAGYSITTLSDVERAVNLSVLLKNTPEHFDLLIAAVEPYQHQLLIDSHRRGIIKRLLLIHNEFDCQDLYCIEDEVGHCCRHSVTLACIQELMHSTTDTNKTVTSLHSRSLRK